MRSFATCVVVGALALLATGLNIDGVFAEEMKHTEDSLPKIQKRIAKKQAVLFDVREPKEWKEGHLQVARLVPLSQLHKDLADEEALAKFKKTLPEKKIIYCHCRSGGRALKVAEMLKKLGFEARAIKPGFEELAEVGFKVAAKETDEGNAADATKDAGD